ncbi:MAG: flagellar motor switch protein FliM [Dehalococcoidales bacterium]|nr:flagellar motor switch protein FliM [Dehalococcoidales bacterium]
MDTEGKTDPEAKKVLGQWEIDALLGSLGNQQEQEVGTTPEAAKNIRPYDFRRPDKFSKEHLRALQTIHESFARGAASSLSSYLRTGIQVRLSSIEQAVYGEYVQQLENPTIINIVSVEPLPGHLIVEFNLPLAFGLIDRLLGGTGHIVQKSREVTDIEFILLQNLVRSLLASLRDAWAQISPLSPNLDDVIFNPQIVQAALPSDVGVLLLFELHIAEDSSIISLFIPYTTLEPIIGKLTSQMWFTGSHKDTTARDDIRHQIEKVAVPIVVSLGTTTVSIRELLGLQKGNVIRLDTSTNQELQVLAGGKHKYWARPGRVGHSLAVAITRVVREEFSKKVPAQEASVAGGVE